MWVIRAYPHQPPLTKAKHLYPQRPPSLRGRAAPAPRAPATRPSSSWQLRGASASATSSSGPPPGAQPGSTTSAALQPPPTPPPPQTLPPLSSSDLSDTAASVRLRLYLPASPSSLPARDACSHSASRTCCWGAGTRAGTLRVHTECARAPGHPSTGSNQVMPHGMRDTDTAAHAYKVANTGPRTYLEHPPPKDRVASEPPSRKGLGWVGRPRRPASCGCARSVSLEGGLHHCRRALEQQNINSGCGRGRCRAAAATTGCYLLALVMPLLAARRQSAQPRPGGGEVEVEGARRPARCPPRCRGCRRRRRRQATAGQQRQRWPSHTRHAGGTRGAGELAVQLEGSRAASTSSINAASGAIVAAASRVVLVRASCCCLLLLPLLLLAMLLGPLQQRTEARCPVQRPARAWARSQHGVRDGAISQRTNAAAGGSAAENPPPDSPTERCSLAPGAPGAAEAAAVHSQGPCSQPAAAAAASPVGSEAAWSSTRPEAAGE